MVFVSLALVMAIVSQPSRVVAASNDSMNWEAASELYPGIRYLRVERREPRRMVVHAVRIDVTTPGLRFHTTRPREPWELGKAETTRQTVRNFMRSSRQAGIPVVLAVNGDAFSPWPAPYDREEPTDLLGLAVSDGIIVSESGGGPSLVIYKDGRVAIEATSERIPLDRVEDAVSGFAMCLKDGEVVQGDESLHPRTGVGLSADRRLLMLFAVDGRQPQSEGATTTQLGQLMKEAGASEGINMDGGGSTTLAWWDPAADPQSACRLLNAPVGNGRSAGLLKPTEFHPSERANGNNFGVYFEPQPSDAGRE